MGLLNNKLYLSIILSISFLIINAQNEANIWYFGNKAGLDFNSGVPTPLSGCAMNTYEGVASIANENGQSLFYTDGIKVWNRNHVQMPNGDNLKGSPSSAQSGVIVPKPGSDNLYYVFCVPKEGGTWLNPAHLYYSLVDMTLDGGMGDVVSTEKNIDLSPDNTIQEKVTAVLHCNMKDIWVIAHEKGSNNFLVYLVTETNAPELINTQAIGETWNTGSYDNIGILKASSQGNLIAETSNYNEKVQVLDFDNATGQLSNARVLTDLDLSYGVEFSPTGRYLYVGIWYHNTPSQIFHQYDLQAPDINASQVTINAGANVGSLQLGPDGKIYVARNVDDSGSGAGKAYLGVINNPENYDGTPGACGYVDEAVFLGGDESNGSAGQLSRYGLPNFIQSYFRDTASVVYQDTCLHDNTTFTATIPFEYDSLRWDFGGIGSSTQNPASHEFPAPGDYEVNLYIIQRCITDTLTQTLTILDSPDLNLVSTNCAADGLSYDVVLAPTVGIITATAGTVSGGNVINIPDGTDVTITAENGNCSHTIDVEAPMCNCPDIPEPTNNGNESICEGNSNSQLSVTNDPTYTCNWYDAQVGGTLLTTGTTYTSPESAPGTYTYYVEHEDIDGCTSDRIEVVFTITANPVIDNLADETVCDSYTLPVLTSGDYFEQSGGNTNIPAGTDITQTQTIYVYAETGTNPNCTTEDSFTITINESPELTLVNTLCSTDLTYYDVELTPTTGLITATAGTVSGNTITGIPDGTNISVYAENNGCYDTLDITAPVCDCPDIPVPTNPQHDTICEGSPTTALSVTVEAGQSAKWYDAPTGGSLLQTGSNYMPTATAAGSYTYYVEAIENATGCRSDRIEVYYEIIAYPVLNTPADVVECDGYTLSAQSSGAYYNQSGGVDPINAGTEITQTQDIYFYAETGTNPNCASEEIFTVTIHQTPDLSLVNSECTPDLTSWYAEISPTVGNITASPGALTGNIISDIPTGQNLWVYAENSNTCFDSLEVIAPDCSCPNIPSPINPNNPSICEGENTPDLTVEPNAGQFIRWYDVQTGGTPLAEGNNLQVNHSNAGTYTYFAEAVDSINACVSSRIEVILTIIAPPVIDTPDNVSVCDSYTLPNITNGNYYNSPNGQNPVNPGTEIQENQIIYVYAETATTPTCKSEYSFLVNVSKTPQIDIHPDTSVCEVYILPELEHGNYYLNPGGTSGLNSGTQLFETRTIYIYAAAADNPSCYRENNFTVTVNQYPEITVNANPPEICQGENTVISASGADSYTWSDNLPAQSSNTVSPSQDKIYYVTATSSGCSVESQIAVTVNDIPIANAGQDQSMCPDSSVTLTGSGGYSYRWSNQQNGESIEVSPDVTTTYTLTVISNQGCQDSDDVTVTVFPASNADAGGDIHVCIGNQVQLTAQYNGSNQYSWLPTTGLSNPNSHNPFVNINETEEYELTVTNSHGCISTDEVFVYIEPKPNANAGENQSVCTGDSVLLTATGGYEYLWQYNPYLNRTDTSSVYTLPESPSNYIVSVTDIHGCSNTDTVFIDVLTRPDIAFKAFPKSGCSPLKVQFKDTAEYIGQTYFWRFDIGDDENVATGRTPVHFFVNDYNYDVELTVTAPNGCTRDTIVNDLITVFPNPDARFDPDKQEQSLLNAHFFFENYSFDAINSFWEFGDGNTSFNYHGQHSYKAPGYYDVKLTVESEHGCLDTEKHKIHVLNEYSFYAPTAFTPNGDDKNEKFRLFSYGTSTQDFTMYIYDRWGEIIFTSNNIEEGWDGKVKNGNIAESGAYTWFATFKDMLGNEYQETGTFILFN